MECKKEIGIFCEQVTPNLQYLFGLAHDFFQNLLTWTGAEDLPVLALTPAPGTHTRSYNARMFPAGLMSETLDCHSNQVSLLGAAWTDQVASNLLSILYPSRTLPFYSPSSFFFFCLDSNSYSQLYLLIQASSHLLKAWLQSYLI